MSGTAPIEGVELDDFIKAQARLEHAPTDVDGVVRALSLPDVDAWKRVEQGWRVRMDEDEHLAEVVTLFLADYVAELRGPSAEAGQTADDDADASVPPVRQEMASYMQAPAASVSASAPLPLAVLRAPVAPPAFVAPPMAPPAPPPASAPGWSEVDSTLPIPAPVSSTAPGDGSAGRGSAPAMSTPFAGRTTPERLQRLRAEANASPDHPSPEPASKGGFSTATMMVPAPESAHPGSQTLPFNAGRKNTDYPELTVDRYAAFAAEVQAKGASRALLARYGIESSQAMVALHREQERRFAADPALRARFEERKAHFLRFMQPTR